MINKHEFQMAAKAFRAGRLSLEQFTAKVYPTSSQTDFPQPAGQPPTPASGQPPKESPSPIPVLPARKRASHKGDYGRILLIGGSSGMAGAISLSSLAALRCGAGLVKVATPASLQPIVAGFSPCYMIVPCADQDGAWPQQVQPELREAIDWADVLAIGPGMGRGPSQQALVAGIFRESVQPVVLDADGLNALADGHVDLKQHQGPRILTPHIGEFDRLVASQSGDSPACRSGDDLRSASDGATDPATREQAAIRLAADSQTIIVLKGDRTLVTNGRETFRNTTGNPGMATGGSGDVLTGMIAALLGQKLNPLEGAILGVHLHGLAGDLAAANKGMVSLIAADLIEQLPAAFLKQTLTQACSGA